MTTQAPPLKLYVYDHCPFCTRVRFLLGVKGIDHELVFLANHDEATPINLVGEKKVPILITPSGKPLVESMEIVRYLDADHGGEPVLNESADREDLKKWMQALDSAAIPLQLPRLYTTPLPEFARSVSREYFRAKKEKMLGVPFSEALEQSPELIKKVNSFLEELEPMLRGQRTVNEELSYDDVDLFPRLRSLTIVKSIKWPTKVREYLEYNSKKGDVLLFDLMAQDGFRICV
ncbi:hypothetical protein Poli38472_004713 [Pythium oligandrum]|uniref:GST N-terminal domain-containing protein n=1 Tax=Pythium oligandrum TaxID=41045 RepID=A0A8K1CAU0_PYTOL|nr:hypothetical protein Poli38472_004713 [Pythium oligandrum]|eukprot:TMW59644.1 hypothetical protein Poli38472_004713 [Pythium oligandrum]